MLEAEIPIPDHTTPSRRLRTLGTIPVRAAADDRPFQLLFDSTDLRIHVGNPRKPPKIWSWRTLLIAVDTATGEIVASDLTSRRTHNCPRVPTLVGQIDNRVTSVSADGAYDAEGVYEAIHAQGQGRHVRVLLPPRRNAQLSRTPSVVSMESNRNIRHIRRLGSREWHKRSGFSKRSLVENAIYRF